MRGLILVLMSNVCYLAVILIFLVVTTRYLVATVDCYSLPSGYCSLPVVTARYRSFPIFLKMVPDETRSTENVLLLSNISLIICMLGWFLNFWIALSTGPLISETSHNKSSLTLMLKVMEQAASCKHRQAVKTIQCEKKFQVSLPFFLS